jgi:hypothetical protein
MSLYFVPLIKVQLSEEYRRWQMRQPARAREREHSRNTQMICLTLKHVSKPYMYYVLFFSSFTSQSYINTISLSLSLFLSLSIYLIAYTGNCSVRVCACDRKDGGADGSAAAVAAAALQAKFAELEQQLAAAAPQAKAAAFTTAAADASAAAAAVSQAAKIAEYEQFPAAAAA